MNQYIYDGFGNVRRYRASWFEYTLIRNGSGCLVEVRDMGGPGVRPSAFSVKLGSIALPIESDLHDLHKVVKALTVSRV